MPLYDYLLEYSRSDVYPFHMPGHKRNPDFFADELFRIDMTETDELDNLHAADGIIKEAMDYAAGVFGSDKTYFLVNGSSCGVIAAVTAVCGDGDLILAARNYHKSFNTALLYSGAKSVYLWPDITEWGLAGGVNPAVLEAALEANPEVKAFYMTSPTYEGFVSDVRRISGIVHKHNKILIVDEAHGAHFAFSDFFPETAVSAGADIVIQSVHKTLPAPTQAALLHIKGGALSQRRLEEALGFTQSSSPSYILMALTDRCIRMLSDDPYIFEKYILRLKYFREQAEKLNSIRLLGSELKGQFSIFDIDCGKLTFVLKGLIGKEIERELFKKYKIQIEMGGRDHIIAMTSAADTPEGFSRLLSALGEIDKNFQSSGSKQASAKTKMNMPQVLPVLSPREAWNREKERVRFSESAGCISAEDIIPYPPGIPILAAGELITQEIIETIGGYRQNSIRITGVRDESLTYINVVK